MNSIAEILLQSGRDQAAARLRQGDIQAQLQSNLANTKAQTIGGIIQPLAALPGTIQAAQQAQLHTQLGQQQLVGAQQDNTLGAARIADLQHQQQGRQVLGAAIKQFSTVDDRGNPVTDHQKIADAVSQAGFPDQANAWLKQASENSDAIEKLSGLTSQHVKAQRELIGDLAYTAKTPEEFAAGLGVLASTPGGGLDEQTAHQLADQLTADPAKAQQLKATYLPFSPKYQAQQAELQKPITTPKDAITTTTERALAGQPPLVTGDHEPARVDVKEGIVDGKPGSVRVARDGTMTNVATNKVTTDFKAPPPASAIVNPGALNDVKESVAGMKDGTLPPMMPGRATKEYLATMAEAHRQGYDLQAAVTDWNATQKHVATLNGQQQTRLNQSINALPDLLDTVDALASKWKGGQFPVLNKANLALAKNGAYGDDVATVARQLDSQIADVTADLGNVYMGGNSPTDQSLALAGKSLSGDWSEKVLHDMVTLARNNVTIRQNSIRNTGVQGASPDNPYVPPSATTTAPAASAPRYTAKNAAGVTVTSSDGVNWVDAQGKPVK